MVGLTRLRLVSFDFVGTIARFAETPGAVYARFAPNLVADASKMQGAFVAAYNDMKKKHPCFGHGEGGVSQRGFWQKTVEVAFEKYGVTDRDAVAGISAQLYDYYASSEPYKLIPQADYVIHQLLRENLHLSIVSNMDSRLRSVLKDFGLYNCFQSIFLSSERGFEKPSPEIYRLLPPETGAKPEEILHIGDRAELDYHPPKHMNMHALLYVGEGSAGEDQRVPPEDKLGALAEVLYKWYDLHDAKALGGHGH